MSFWQSPSVTGFNPIPCGFTQKTLYFNTTLDSGIFFRVYGIYIQSLDLVVFGTLGEHPKLQFFMGFWWILLAGWSNFRPTRLSVGIVRGFSWELTMNYIWLVVLTILKNRKVNEKEYPIYKMENKKMFETTNQILNDTVVYVLWDSSIFLLWYGYIVEKWWLISSHNYGKSPYLTGNWCFIELNRPWLP